MTRILLVCNQFPKLSESFIVRKLLGLMRMGWDVQIACNRSDAEQWDHFKQLLPRADFAAHVHLVEDFDELAERLAPDLVHFEFGHLVRGRAGSPALGRSRVVASLRGNDVHALGLDDPTYYDELWQGVDALHVLTPRLFEKAVTRGCPPTMPYVSVPPAVDATVFDPGRRTYGRVGTAVRPFRILSVGRLHWMKAYSTSLHAVALLRARGVHCEYRILGAPDYGEGLIEVLFGIHDHGLSDVVTLLGGAPQEGVLHQLRWADTLLHGAVSEGFCNAALEAQAMALPVVCTEALVDNVLDGTTGLVAPLRDAAGLATRLERLARDAKLRRRLGSAGRKRVVEEFALENQVAKFSDWYRALLASDGERSELRALRIRLRRQRTELVHLEDERDRLARDVGRREGLLAVEALIEEFVPDGDEILVVTRGDAALVELRAEASHFPQAENGDWLGHHPASSVEAVAQLERLRLDGARFLVFPRTGLWWLEHYRGLRDHLEDNYVCVKHHEDTGAIFDLGPVLSELTAASAAQKVVA